MQSIKEETMEDNDYGFFCDIESNFREQYFENKIHLKRKKIIIEPEEIYYSIEKEKEKISSFAVTIYILSSFAFIGLCFIL